MPVVLTTGSATKVIDLVNEISPGKVTLFSGLSVFVESSVTFSETVSVLASDSFNAGSRVLTITVDSLTGTGSPTASLTALTLDGDDVIGDKTGTGPWFYVVPSGDHTVAWTVTATNGVDSDTSSGSEVVTAAPASEGSFSSAFSSAFDVAA